MITLNLLRFRVRYLSFYKYVPQYLPFPCHGHRIHEWVCVLFHWQELLSEQNATNSLQHLFWGHIFEVIETQQVSIDDSSYRVIPSNSMRITLHAVMNQPKTLSHRTLTVSHWAHFYTVGHRISVSSWLLMLCCEIISDPHLYWPT